jgi:LysM repeat protein
VSCLGSWYLKTGYGWRHCVRSLRMIPPVFNTLQAGIQHASRLSDAILVKALTPFVPTVCLITVPSRRRRELFKKVFFGVLAAPLVLLLGLLITDYHHELVVSAKELPGGPAPVAVPAAGVLAASSAPGQAALPRPPAASTQAPARPETVYSVISSDTLDGIAKRHGTTVKAIRAANGLSTDRLSIGQRLMIPSPSA